MPGRFNLTPFPFGSRQGQADLRRSARSVGGHGIRIVPDTFSFQTWSGRGKRPVWFNEALKKLGVTTESLLTQGATKATPAKKASAKAVKKAPAKKKAAKK